MVVLSQSTTGVEAVTTVLAENSEVEVVHPLVKPIIIDCLILLQYLLDTEDNEG